MNALEKFITDFQAKAMVYGSKHHVTGRHMARGWHSDNIIQACIDEFGMEGLNDKDVARDVKEFLVEQINEK